MLNQSPHQEEGGVAQMVERSLSMREVQGSIPCISTFSPLIPLPVVCLPPGTDSAPVCLELCALWCAHTFSAFWLRSSVVSVLISLISDNALPERRYWTNFLMGLWVALLCRHPSTRVRWAAHIQRDALPLYIWVHPPQHTQDSRCSPADAAILW